MLRALATHRARRRSGAVLIVVLAMLVLFAVLGLSFVLYSEAQLSAARSQKLSVNEETEPNPQASAEGWMGPFIYDVSDTGDDLTNPIRAHSLARSKYSLRYDPATGLYIPQLLPFSGAPAPYTGAEPVSMGAVTIPDRRQIVRYTWDQPNGGVFDPERVYGAATARNTTTVPATGLPGTYQGKNFPFTYPDRHDFYLAQVDPTTGEITVPSFHRPDLGSWNPAAADYFANPANQPAAKFKTVRPIPVAGQHPNFPPVPMNADGTYTGDVANLKFMTGSQKNDSLWMDAGGPVLKWRGKVYKAMVAPLVLDLSGRVNLSIAGNMKGGNGTTHGSGQGWGPWEVNPLRLGDGATLTTADLQALVQRRYGTSATPQFDPYTNVASTTRMNHGLMPPLSSKIDPDGNVPSGTDAAMALPLPPPGDGYTTYPGFASTRFAPDQATALTGLTSRLQNHPAQFNPLLPSRQAISATTPTGGLGLDALAATASRHSSGVAKRPAGYGYGVPGLAPTPDTPNAQLVRNLVTAFSTSQQFGTLQIANSTGGTTVLGPIDVNRPLADFRKDPTQPYSPANVWNPSLGGADLTNYQAAVRDRQSLARDLFVRFAACGMFGIGGTYDTTTGYLAITDLPGSANYLKYQETAQSAVNVVDYLDNDDITTQFVWNPVFPSTASDPSVDPNNFAVTPTNEMANRVAFGTELPRLVINEAYCGLFNDPNERSLNATTLPTRTPKRQYWVELHNPTPPNDAARADNGAARLEYVPGKGGYTGTRYNPYRVEVATNDGTNVVLQALVNQYTDASGNAFVAGAANDEGNLIRPATATTGTPGQNNGYYLLGPNDPFPSNNTTNTAGLAYAADGTPLPAQNTLAVDAAAANWMDDASVTTEANKTNVFTLRRLTNPYLLPNDPANTGATPPDPRFPYDATRPANPYITVDALQNIPTADRVRFLNKAVNNAHTPDATQNRRATSGRRHPYGNGTGPRDPINLDDMIVYQGAANATPNHTFFSLNASPLNNNNGGTTGFSWVPHLDREAVNVSELFWATLESPASRTSVVRLLGGVEQAPRLFRGSAYQSFGIVGRIPIFGVLATGPRLPGSPVGGREAGRVNVNTMNHQSVLNALLDPQAGNAFAANVNQSNQVWNYIQGAGSGARSDATGVPKATGYEGGTDVPFSGFVGYSMTDTTLLRRDATSAPVVGNSAAPANDYFQFEPLRKLWNSTTTVSDSFLVVMTVSFFEVENAGPWGVTNQPQLGRELFDKVPGDLRAQFASVVDRSCLTVADPQTAPTTPGATTPFQTKLTADVGVAATTVEIEAVPPGGLIPTGFVGAGSAVPANTCALLGNGQVLYVNATAGASTTNRLWVGYGNSYDATAPGDGEWLTVGATITANAAKPGTATVTVSATTHRHGGGTLVTNVPFGHPGPQSGVTLAQLKQRGLVPYFTRLEP